MSVNKIETTQQNNTSSPPIVAQRNIIPIITAATVIGETFVPQVTNATRQTLQNDTISPPSGTQENSSPQETASVVIEETHVPQSTAATRRSSRATKKTESYAPAENPVRNTQVKWNETRWLRNHKRKGRVTLFRFTSLACFGQDFRPGRMTISSWWLCCCASWLRCLEERVFLHCLRILLPECCCSLVRRSEGCLCRFVEFASWRW